MQKLSITKRPGQLKGSITSRPELHGDDVVGALTISVGGILLFARDLIAMYNNEDAHNRLFKSSDAGLVPAFPGTLLLITEIFKGAKVTLTAANMTKALILKPATIKDIQLDAQDAGGHVIMSCKILGAPPDDDNVNPLHMLNQKCTIAILNGALAAKDDKQGVLPLDEGGPQVSVDNAGVVHNDGMTELEREEEEATRLAQGGEMQESNIGRQIRRSAAKTKRASKKK
jgi:hypothetical protein